MIQLVMGRIRRKDVREEFIHSRIIHTCNAGRIMDAFIQARQLFRSVIDDSQMDRGSLSLTEAPAGRILRHDDQGRLSFFSSHLSECCCLQGLSGFRIHSVGSDVPVQHTVDLIRVLARDCGVCHQS